MKKETNKYSPEEISSFLNMFTVCHEKAGMTIVNVLSLLPKEIVDFVADNIAIIAGYETEGGSYWNFKHFCFKKKKGFLWLDANLWGKPRTEIVYTIVREVAHAYLGHNTNSREEVEFGLDNIIKEEGDADRLAIGWLAGEIDGKKLLKFANYPIE
jgi:hypothetical protein